MEEASSEAAVSLVRKDYRTMAEKGQVDPTPPTYKVWPQYAAAIAANIGALMAGTVLAWSSPGLSYLKSNENSPFRPTDEEGSWIGSLAALGAACGPFSAGYLSDNVGRKLTMLSTVPLVLLSWVMIGSAKSLALVLIGRFIAGFAISTVFAIGPNYVGEISTPEVRGVMGSFLQVLISVGYVFTYSIGPYVEYSILAVLSSIIPVIFFVCVLIIPDSPYSLIALGRTTEAKAALEWLRRVPWPQLENEFKEIEDNVKEEMSTKGSIMDLFKTKGNVKALILTFGLTGFQQLSGINVILFYTEEIFSSAGGSLGPAEATILIGVVMLAASCVTPFVVDRMGRKFLLITSSVGSCITLVALGVYFYLQKQGQHEGLGWLPITSLLVYMAFYCFGYGPLPWAIMGELFPSNIKSNASALTTFWCWIIGFLLTKFFTNIKSALGDEWAFWIFAIFCVISLFFFIFILPETKGKTLQEIQDILNGKA